MQWGGKCGILGEHSEECRKTGNGGVSMTVTEVVAALIWEGDRFMICQRPAHKTRGLLWEFVGGKVEPGETKEQALIRECREELAVTVSVGDVFMDVVHEYPDLLVHLTLFHASIAVGEPQKIEHNDIRWITTAEIPNYPFCPADEEILIMESFPGQFSLDRLPQALHRLFPALIQEPFPFQKPVLLRLFAAAGHALAHRLSSFV